MTFRPAPSQPSLAPLQLTPPQSPLPPSPQSWQQPQFMPQSPMRTQPALGQFAPQQPVTSMPPQPTQPMQMGAMPNGTPAVAPQNLAKEKKLSLVLGVASIAVFVVGIFVGFAAVAGAVLGAFAARKAYFIHFSPGIALGITGAVLNIGYYLVAVLVK